MKSQTAFQPGTPELAASSSPERIHGRISAVLRDHARFGEAQYAVLAAGGRAISPDSSNYPAFDQASDAGADTGAL